MINNKIRGRAIAVETQMEYAKRASKVFDLTPEFLMAQMSLAGFQFLPDTDEVMLDAAAIAAHQKAERRGEFRLVTDDDNPFSS